MSFVNEYLAKQGVRNGRIKIPPHSDLGIIIVIPCYNEPYVIKTLESLHRCDRTQTKVEIIVVINTAENTPEKIIDQNKKTINEVDTWNKLNSGISVHLLNIENIPARKAGVGYARKLGMDEAVYRFNLLNNYNGVIMSLDADTIVEANYLMEVEKQFYLNDKPNTCVLYFEHPTDGNEFSEDVYTAITQYELYLRYYLQAVRYTGYPYAYHTVGSCFGVKTGTYVKQGGMNKRQAGEDFYFLQKVFPLGGVIEINTTKVIPSPRPSDRVPFGTGPVVKKISESDDDYMTYDFQAFIDLKLLFDRLSILFDDPNIYLQIKVELPKVLNDFSESIQLNEILRESKENSSTFQIFRKRFHNRFNAFQILKYLNYSHEKCYAMKKVDNAAMQLLMLTENYCLNDSKELLEKYRSFENNNSI